MMLYNITSIAQPRHTNILTSTFTITLITLLSLLSYHIRYLRNLDLDSAHYDPKARSMRANPYEGTNVNPEDVSFAGDNFERITGDAVELAKAQVLAWEMQVSITITLKP